MKHTAGNKRGGWLAANWMTYRTVVRRAILHRMPEGEKEVCKGWELVHHRNSFPSQQPRHVCLDNRLMRRQVMWHLKGGVNLVLP